MRGAFGGVGEQTHPIGLRAAGCPHFAAVDDIVIPVGAGKSLDGGDVGAGADFADAEARDVIAGNRRGQKFALELVRAEARERRRRHVGLHADRHRHAAAADRAELFGHHHPIGIVEPEPAVFGRLVEAEKSEASQLLEKLMGGKLSLGFPRVDMRIDLVGDETLQRAPRLFVFGSE